MQCRSLPNLLNCDTSPLDASSTPHPSVLRCEPLRVSRQGSSSLHPSVLRCEPQSASMDLGATGEPRRTRRGTEDRTEFHRSVVVFRFDVEWNLGCASQLRLVLRGSPVAPRSIDADCGSHLRTDGWGAEGVRIGARSGLLLWPDGEWRRGANNARSKVSP
jgi:hypothetical protein